VRAERNHKTVANTSFENVTEVKYLGKAVTNKNYVEEEIKRRLNSANAYILRSLHILAIPGASRQIGRDNCT
jgi:hypothetical protein